MIQTSKIIVIIFGLDEGIVSIEFHKVGYINSFLIQFG